MSETKQEWRCEPCGSGGGLLIRPGLPQPYSGQERIQIVPLEHAYLFAAAPEMYEALKILVNALGFNPAGKSKAIKQKRDDAIQDGWEKGGAALAKADGK